MLTWQRATFAIVAILVLRSHAFASVSPPAGPNSLAPGLVMTWRNGSQAAAVDSIVLPNAAFYVRAGQSPTPFLNGAPFEVTCTGYITSELKNEYRFQVESSGPFRLVINGVPLLTSVSADLGPHLSEFARLNKGTNSLQLTFTSPPGQNAYLRLWWLPKGGVLAPVPPETLSHVATALEVKQSEQLHLGRHLFLERRCVNCHALSKEMPPDSSAAQAGPSLEHIGSRRQFAWLVKWVTNPPTQRRGAQMPQIFSVGSQTNAEAIAAYLRSLRGATAPPTGTSEGPSADRASLGRKLFESLHCNACHNSPEAGERDPSRIDLDNVGERFGPGGLVAFLLCPESDFPAIRMPNFKLSAEEASALAQYLAGSSSSGPTSEAVSALIGRGRDLVQSSGCLNCHALKLDNRFKAKPFAELGNAGPESGCLAPQPVANGGTPFFDLTADERSALATFLHSGSEAALAQTAPLEDVPRQLTVLRCAACHGKFEGFPKLELLFGKFRPEWAVPFVKGELSYRPRPWLEARMPAFPHYGASLGSGLALLSGYPPSTPPGPAVDPAAAATGYKLVGADGGLSCVACHAVGAARASQVFENAGINFAYIGARLLKPYFERWVRSPLLVDPVTKMPTFFDEEMRSPLTDIYDGDGAKQLDAIWQYLQSAEKFPPPAGTAPVPAE
jgi:mono/diheme cytochrome c family protein